jgi:hypothetical protein
LWNEAEKAEKRKNSCVGRELLVALPHEMSDGQRRALAENITVALVERYGVAASCGIHAPDAEGLNHHAHILFSTRRLTAEGFGEKTRELDDQTQGKVEVCHLREQVASLTNQHLEQAGIGSQVDHRSLENQRLAALAEGRVVEAIALDREPTKHEGRNPEVRARVQEENEQKAERNQQKIIGAMEQLEAQAQAEHRLMPAYQETKTPEQLERAEKQANKERNREKHEREIHVWQAGHEKLVAERDESRRVDARILQELEKRQSVGRQVKDGVWYAEREFNGTLKSHSEAKTKLRAWNQEHPNLKRLGEALPMFKAKEQRELEERLIKKTESLERKRESLNALKERAEEAKDAIVHVKEVLDGQKYWLDLREKAVEEAERARRVLSENHAFENETRAERAVKNAQKKAQSVDLGSGWKPSDARLEAEAEQTAQAEPESQKRTRSLHP